MNTLVISHHHYPANLLNTISSNLSISLEKQTVWAIET